MDSMNSRHPMSRVAGLMAGTSLDGIDVALVETDGRQLERLGISSTHPYSNEVQGLLREAVALGAGILTDDAMRGTLDRLVADEHAQVVQDLVDHHGDVSLVGFHGQTVWHAPEAGQTVQLGDPQRLADQLGVAVIGQLRAADIAAGGEGAPLAPVYHASMLQQAGVAGSAAWLNIGGVANLTLVDDEVIAGFDCGPGNALLDRLVLHQTGKPWDAGGALALTGTVNAMLVKQALSDEYFSRQPPKSLDRDFFLQFEWLRAVERLPLNDALATLAAVTVAGVCRGLAESPSPVQTLVVSGGGVHNAAIMEGLRDGGGWQIVSSDDIGAPADGVEAELVAFLAARRVAGLATSFPMTTGVARPVVGGVEYLPRNRA